MIVYQFYSELEDYKPRIWRRFQVARNISVAELGYIVMAMYEMKASHLLCIEHEKPRLTPSGRIGQRMDLLGRYGFSSGEDDDDMQDAAASKLAHVDLAAPSRLVVWYDFGDDWRVIVKLEEELDIPDLPRGELPRVLAGAGFGILEDCGGIYGLMDLAAEFKDKGPEYEEYCAEVGVNDLDLEKLDLEDVNFRLKKLPRIFAKIYEQKLRPSQRAINFIERKYVKKAGKGGTKRD